MASFPFPCPAGLHAPPTEAALGTASGVEGQLQQIVRSFEDEGPPPSFDGKAIPRGETSHLEPGLSNGTARHRPRRGGIEERPVFLLQIRRDEGGKDGLCGFMVRRVGMAVRPLERRVAGDGGEGPDDDPSSGSAVVANAHPRAGESLISQPQLGVCRRAGRHLLQEMAQRRSHHEGKGRGEAQVVPGRKDLPLPAEPGKGEELEVPLPEHESLVVQEGRQIFRQKTIDRRLQDVQIRPRQTQRRTALRLERQLQMHVFCPFFGP